jgi:hypothetical protein
LSGYVAVVLSFWHFGTRATTTLAHWQQVLSALVLQRGTCYWVHPTVFGSLREVDAGTDEEGSGSTPKSMVLSGLSSISLVKGHRCHEVSIGLMVVKTPYSRLS